MWKHFSDWVSIYMQITWERGNVWRKHRKEGKAGENIGERGYVWRKTMEEMVCLKKTLEKGYVNRKHERESMQHMRQNREGGASPGYVWRTHARESMFGCQEQHCRKGLYGENNEERVCLEKHFRKGMFGENISNGMFEENI